MDRGCGFDKTEGCGYLISEKVCAAPDKECLACEGLDRVACCPLNILTLIRYFDSGKTVQVRKKFDIIYVRGERSPLSLYFDTRWWLWSPPAKMLRCLHRAMCRRCDHAHYKEMTSQEWGRCSIWPEGMSLR